MIIQKMISVHLTRKRNANFIDVVQYDTGIQLVFDVQDFEIPSGTTATLHVQKPSGKFVYQQDDIVVSGNVITVDLKNQAVTEHGNAQYQLQLINGSDTVSTFSGIMRVAKSLANSSATESQVVIDAFNLMNANKANGLTAEASGNPVEIYPDEGSLLRPVVTLGVVQEGDGDPSPDNIRQIVRHEYITVDVNGHEHHIILGNPICAGEVDCDSRKITSIHAYLELTGNEPWVTQGSGNNLYFRTRIGSTNNVTDVQYCSHAVNRAASGGILSSNTNRGFYVYYSASNEELRLSIRPGASSVTDLETWKTYLKLQKHMGTPVQIVYELTESYSVPFDPDPIIATDGLNTVSTNGDGLTVIYNKSLHKVFEEILERIAVLESK